VGASDTMAMKTIHEQAARRRTAQRSHRVEDLSDGGRPARTPAPSMLRWGSDKSLPSEMEQLLVDVVADGFIVYCCGPRSAPWALVAAYPWDDYVDLVTIRRFDQIITARIPAPPRARIDVFDPKAVVWAYEGPPQPALRALLNLLPPHHPDAPTSAYPAPPGLHIPRTEQRPLTIRVPPPQRAGTRADRLAVMAADRGEGLKGADGELRSRP
jgi:hypothetical protein